MPVWISHIGKRRMCNGQLLTMDEAVLWAWWSAPISREHWLEQLAWRLAVVGSVLSFLGVQLVIWMAFHQIYLCKEAGKRGYSNRKPGKFPLSPFKWKPDEICRKIIHKNIGFACGSIGMPRMFWCSRKGWTWPHGKTCISALHILHCLPFGLTFMALRLLGRLKCKA